MGCFAVPALVSATAAVAGRKDSPRRLKALAAVEALVTAVSVVEHVVHGELTWAWPFVTGGETLKEMAVEGGLLALAGVAAWGAGVWAYEKFVLRHRLRQA